MNHNPEQLKAIPPVEVQGVENLPLIDLTVNGRALTREEFSKLSTIAAKASEAAIQAVSPHLAYVLVLRAGVGSTVSSSLPQAVAANALAHAVANVLRTEPQDLPALDQITDD